MQVGGKARPHGDLHQATMPRAPATPTHLLGSPQRSLVSEEGASVTRGSVRERRLEMQRRWLAMQATWRSRTECCEAATLAGMAGDMAKNGERSRE